MSGMNTQAPPDQASLDAQLVQMLATVPRGALRREYEDVNAAAKHCKSLLNQLSFKPNPIFTWVSAEGTTWSTNKLKHNSSRKLAISLWKDDVIRLIKEPTMHNPENQISASAAVMPLANTNNLILPSEDFGSPPPTEAMVEAEAAAASSSKRKGKQTMVPSKAPKTKANQDIAQFFNRATSPPIASSSRTSMTLRRSSPAKTSANQAVSSEDDDDHVPPVRSYNMRARRPRPVILDDEDDEEPERPQQSEQPEQALPRSCGLIWLKSSRHFLAMMIGKIEIDCDPDTNTIPMAPLVKLRVGSDAQTQSLAYRNAQTDITNFAGDAMIKEGGKYRVPVDIARRWLRRWGIESRASLFLAWADGSIDLSPITEAVTCAQCEAVLKFSNPNTQKTARGHLGEHQGQKPLKHPENIRICLDCHYIFHTVKGHANHDCPGSID